MLSTVCLFCHILWGQVSLRICAASEQKLECERVSGESEGELRHYFAEKLNFVRAPFQQFQLRFISP